MKIFKLAVLVLCAVALVGFLAGFATAQSRGRDRGESSIENDPLEQSLPPNIRVRAFIHRPRVVEPSHLGTCSATADGTIGNYGLAGWHLPTAGVTWKLNMSTVPTTYLTAAAAHDAIVTAFATWNAADGKEKFLDGGTTTVKAAKFDGVNAVLWRRLSPSTIGVTYVWYYTSTHEVAEVDTVFNSRYPWALFDANLGECQSSPDAYDLLNIATHEFGHWTGLDDLYDTVDEDLTMYGFGAGGELKKRTLGTGDIDGVNAVLP